MCEQSVGRIHDSKSAGDHTSVRPWQHAQSRHLSAAIGMH